MGKKEKEPRPYRGVIDEIREQQHKTKDMSLKGKWQYFWDYYKVHTITAVVVILLGGTLIHDILSAKDYAFYGIMLNSIGLSAESMETAFSEYAGIDLETYDCFIDTSSTLSYSTPSEYDMATMQKMVAQVQGHDLDAVVDQIAMYSASLRETFHISLWLLIVPVITGILIAKRIPSIITLFISATLAGIFALFFQPHLLQEISGLPVQDMQSQFKGLIMTFYGSTQVQTGNPDLNDLVSTRGMSGMMNTIWLIICAMCFGGAMTASGMLGSITSVFIRFMKRTVGLVASTVASGLFLNICTADQYISIILTGNMFKDIYQKKGYESRLLSRTTEDSVTVTSVLIPWNTCGMTQATILGVATFTYLPYCFFNLISPLMSITVAAIGFKIKRINEKAESIATD